MIKNVKLFLTFFEIGITSFGGGLAMLPMMEEKLVKELNWISKEELLDYYAIAQCTPGIIAMNVATMVGKKQNKLVGAIFATLGMIAPSILIISIISYFLKGFMQYKILNKFLSGIKLGACGLIMVSLYKMFKNNIKDFNSLVLLIGSFILVLFNILSPVAILLIICLFAFIKTREAKDV